VTYFKHALKPPRFGASFVSIPIFKTLRVIQGYLALQMTAGLYSHVLPEIKQKEMQRITGLF